MYRASIPPFAYSLCCVVGFAVLRSMNKAKLASLERNVSVFRHVQLFLILMLPLVMHIILGGLSGSRSSDVMTWSIIAPAASIFYYLRPSTHAVRPDIHGWAAGRWTFALLHGITRSLPVLVDASVFQAAVWFVGLSVALIACDPLLQTPDTPPLLLRQVFGALNLIGPIAILLAVAVVLRTELAARRRRVLHSVAQLRVRPRAREDLLASFIPPQAAAELDHVPPPEWMARGPDRYAAQPDAGRLSRRG